MTHRQRVQEVRIGSCKIVSSDKAQPHQEEDLEDGLAEHCEGTV